jgi:hypothetical protein
MIWKERAFSELWEFFLSEYKVMIWKERACSELWEFFLSEYTVGESKVGLMDKFCPFKNWMEWNIRL